MKFSIIIPAYNAAATIEATLNAVLSQTVPPAEILVFDDGSTDDTMRLLKAYQPRIKVFHQPNQGVAHARNFLCAQARGDVLAFLDADDLWHPRYLEVQCQLLQAQPKAVAYFTEHENFVGFENYQWQNDAISPTIPSELIGPMEFVIRYNRTPLSFQMSCCCLRRGVLAEFGAEPFRITGADDTYVHNLLPLIGPVAHSSARPVAYRIHKGTISSNQLKMALLVADAFELLDDQYKKKANASLYGLFRAVHASRQRNCGKFLMGAGRIPEARQQFLKAALKSRNPNSVAKSIALYGLTHLPHSLQPRWPAAQRVFKARNQDAIGGRN